MAWVSASSVTGLLTTASTPGGCSALAPIRSPKPVSMITDVSGADRSMVAASWSPPISGIARSVTIRSKRPAANRSSPSRPFAAVSTLCPLAVELRDDGHAHERIVVHQQDVQRPQRLLQLDVRAGGRRLVPDGKPHDEHTAPARLALDRQRPAVALDGGVHEREPEAGTVLALRREEGLQAALPDLVRHAGAGVADLEFYLGAFRACAHRDRTALRPGVDRVEDQVGEHLPDPGRVPLDDRCAEHAGIDADRDALTEGLVLPARLRQGHHFVDAAAEVDRPVDGGLAPVAV